MRAWVAALLCAGATAWGGEPGGGADWREQAHASRTPEWAKDRLPAAILPYVGARGLPPPFAQRTKPLGDAVAGIDRWQANRFIAYRPETADFLYRSYTPLKVAYRKGTLPRYEKCVERTTRGLATARERAVALLTRALPREFRHPTMAPLGKPCRADRALLDEPLLASGTGFCNEQARVFTRLCHVAGIPARIVHLFYADRRTGHTIAEFHADGRWSMADASWFCVFPAADGHLMSAAQCHEKGEARRHVGKAYVARFQQIVALSDEDLVGQHFTDTRDPERRARQVAARAAKTRERLRSRTAQELGDQLWAFAIINNPLPR